MITVYTQPDCRPCKRVMDKLTAAGISFETVDISKNAFAKDFVTRVYQAKSTPVIEYADGQAIVGYQPDKLKELINSFGGSDAAPQF